MSERKAPRVQPDEGEATESAVQKPMPNEIGGPKRPEPARYGDCEVNAQCSEL